MTRRRSNPVLFAHVMAKVSRAARRKGHLRDYLQARRMVLETENITFS